MAIRIDRVYTRTGDDGETGLAGIGRVPKDCPRIEAMGEVDELNSAVGLAREEIAAAGSPAEGLRTEIEPLLLRTQQKLVDLGARLSLAPRQHLEEAPGVGAEDVHVLEEEMDRWGKELEPLGSFILPGGSRAGAQLHVCRAVCRRAERALVRLHRTEPVERTALQFLNRLADWLFVAARIAAKRLGAQEALWTPSPPKNS